VFDHLLRERRILPPTMPHTPAEKKKALTRVRRLRGQMEALERALEVGADCGPVLQQLAAIRGAVNGLMAEVLESHLREEFGESAKDVAGTEAIEQAIALVRSYLK
jgi:FrmR/RcnR family transcriptional regulator, repressor of frmRAB operon